MLQSGKIEMDGEGSLYFMPCRYTYVALTNHILITYVCILFYSGTLCTLLVCVTAHQPLHQPCSMPILKLLPFPILKRNNIHYTLQHFTVLMVHCCSVCIIAIPMLSKQGRRLMAGFRCTWHVIKMQLQEQYAYCLSTTRMQQR